MSTKDNDVPDKIIALDHTKLRDRPKRIWTFGEYALPGIYLPGLYAGAATATIGMAGTLLISRLPIGGPIVIIGLLLSVSAAILVGSLWGKFKPDGMTPGQWVGVELDYRFRQPKAFHGFSKDTEPKTLHWTVIVWAPTTDPHVTRRLAAVR